MERRTFTILITGVIGAFFWWGAFPSVAAEGKLRVVTTTLSGYALARGVADGMASVENLLPGNVSLHDYQLSPADLQKLKGADLIVVNGLGLEAFLEKAIRNLGPGVARKVVTLTDGLKSELIEDGGHHDHSHEGAHSHEHGANPHVWLDPLLAAHGVTNLADGLARADAANAEKYRKSAAAVVERLQRLDAEIRERLAPVKMVPFITYHNAFPYFTRRYGLNLAGVVEEVAEVTPSPREMSALRRIIREKKVKALFTEPAQNPKLARQIAADNKITLGELDPLETGRLEPEAYEAGMRKNIDALLKALR